MAPTEVYRATITFTTDNILNHRRTRNTFADRINPEQFHFSLLMVAIVGAIIGHDYKISPAYADTYQSLSITSDGFVIGTSLEHPSGTYLGHHDNLMRNINLLLDHLSVEDRDEFLRLYKANVRDWSRP